MHMHMIVLFSIQQHDIVSEVLAWVVIMPYCTLLNHSTLIPQMNGQDGNVDLNSSTWHWSYQKKIKKPSQYTPLLFG